MGHGNGFWGNLPPIMGFQIPTLSSGIPYKLSIFLSRHLKTCYNSFFTILLVLCFKVLVICDGCRYTDFRLSPIGAWFANACHHERKWQERVESSRGKSAVIYYFSLPRIGFDSKDSLYTLIIIPDSLHHISNIIVLFTVVFIGVHAMQWWMT